MLIKFCRHWIDCNYLRRHDVFIIKLCIIYIHCCCYPGLSIFTKVNILYLHAEKFETGSRFAGYRLRKIYVLKEENFYARPVFGENGRQKHSEASWGNYFKVIWYFVDSLLLHFCFMLRIWQIIFWSNSKNVYLII